MQAAYDQLTKQKVTIFGVSTDNAPTQRKFCNKHSLKYSLIADTNKKVTTAFKVPLIKSKLASRQAYLFYNGVLVWRDLKASTATQGKDALKAIKTSAP